MMRRRAMPARRGGLVRAAATTAVVAGTATAVSGRVARRQDAKAQESMNEQMADQAAFESQQQIADLQAQMSQMQAQQAQGTMAPPPAAPAGGSVDVVARLQQLGQLKDAGLLSDEEFAAAKAQLLGG